MTKYTGLHAKLQDRDGYAAEQRSKQTRHEVERDEIDISIREIKEQNKLIENENKK
jgi:hypothetical protein